MRNHQAELTDMTIIWSKAKDYISFPHSKTQYNKLVKYLDTLIDDIGDDQDHPLATLMETLGILIEAYEKRMLPVPPKDNVSIIKSLMIEHNLKQKDMPEIGSQGVVSEILNGKRRLNTRQIQALAKKFNISTSVFME